MATLEKTKKYRYPGIQPFNQKQHSIFYGRNKDIDALFRLITLEKEVLLYGKSGLGKSSLINAGLIHKIKEETKYIPILIRFGGYSINKTDSPISIIKSTLSNNLGDSKNDYLRNIISEDLSLWRKIKNHQIETSKNNFILIFDQFEELFTYPKKVIEEFKSELSEVLFSEIPQRYRNRIEEEFHKNNSYSIKNEVAKLDIPLKVKTLFVIREDKMSLLNNLVTHIPNILKNSFQLEALDETQTEEAILNPAYSNSNDFESPVFDFEDEAIEFITSYLTKNNSQRTEPFQLQILCETIEQKVINKKLRKISTHDIQNIDSIYENYYENQLNLINEPEREIARTLIESGLINENEERRMGLYKRQMEDLFGISNNLLEQLINTRLIRAVEDTRGGNIYELCHDSLIQPILKSRREKIGEKVNAELKEVKEKFSTEQKKRKAWQKISIIGGLLILLLIIFFISFQNIELKKQNEKTNSDLSQTIKEKEKSELQVKVNNLTSAALMAGKLNKTVALNLINRALDLDFNNEVVNGVRNDLLNSNFSFPFYKNSLKGHEDYVNGVKILNGGNNFITISGRSIYYWNKEGKLIKTIEAHKEKILSLDVSPSGKRIITSGNGYDKHIKLWNSKVELIKDFGECHRSAITSVKFLNEDFILSGGHDKVGKLWNSNGKLIEEYKEHNKTIGCIAISRSENLFLLGSEGDLSFSVRSLKDSLIRTVDSLKYLVSSATFSKNKRFILTGLSDGTVYLWDYNLKLILSLRAHDRFVSEIICLEDSFITSSWDKSIKEWFYDGRLVRTFKGHEDAIISIDVDEKKNLLVSGSEDGTVKIWNLSPYSRHSIKGHKSIISSLNFSKDGNSFISGSWDNTFKIWDLEGQLINSGRHNNNKGVIRVAKFSQDGEKYITGGSDGYVKIWNKKLQLIRKFNLGNDVFDIEYSNKGDYIIGAGIKRDAGIAKLWDKQGDLITTFEGHNSRINDVEFSPNDSLIMTVSDDKTIVLWDKEGNIVIRISKEPDKVKTAKFSPDGNFIFSGGWDNRIKKWDLKGNLLKVFIGHESDVNKLVVLPKRKIILSGSSDYKVKIWNFEGIQQPNYIELTNSVYGLASSPNEELIITGGKDYLIGIWDYDNIQEILNNVELLTNDELIRYGL